MLCACDSVKEGLSHVRSYSLNKAQSASESEFGVKKGSGRLPRSDDLPSGLPERSARCIHTFVSRVTDTKQPLSLPPSARDKVCLRALR